MHVLVVDDDEDITLFIKEALAQHALEDWEKLGRKEKPSDLTLHKPQVASAEADRASPNASGYRRTIWVAMSICSSWTRAAPAPATSQGM